MDFNTALARLLRDGKLRDAFRADPRKALAEMALEDVDRRALEGLDFAGLEVQADILLHKRFDLVKRWMPGTCEKAGRPAFRVFARNQWPEDGLRDARQFCGYLAFSGQLEPAENNRVRFLAGASRFSLHGVARSSSSPAGVQVFWRWRGRWREWFFAFRL